MTQEEIIEMAREAGIGWGEGIGGMPDFLEAFANLVAAKEREACAMVCETRLGPTATDFYGKAYADAIRARGEA